MLLSPFLRDSTAVKTSERPLTTKPDFLLIKLGPSIRSLRKGRREAAGLTGGSLGELALQRRIPGWKNEFRVGIFNIVFDVPL